MPTGRDVEIIAVVLNKILNDGGYAFDNIFSKVPLINYLMLKDSKDGATLGTNNRVRKLDGGYEIEIPLEYAVGSSMQFFDGLDVITFALKETDTNAKYAWKNAAQTLLLDNKDILKCQGDARKITNFVGSKLRNMNKSMATSINTAFLNLSPATNDFHSIPVLVDYAPSGARTVGGIDQSASINSWWRNKTAASDATTWAHLMAEIDNLFNTICYNSAGDKPDLALTDQNFYECLLAYLRSKGTHQFMDNEMSRVFDIEVPKIRGMGVVWDTGVQEPASEASHSAMYMLNTDYLQFCVHQDRQFALEGPEKLIFSQGQDATAWVVLLMGNLTCSNRSKQGVLYSIDYAIAS